MIPNPGHHFSHSLDICFLHTISEWHIITYPSPRHLPFTLKSNIHINNPKQAKFYVQSGPLYYFYCYNLLPDDGEYFKLVYGSLAIISCALPQLFRGIILGEGSANERRCNTVTPPLIGWAHTQNDPWFNASRQQIKAKQPAHSRRLSKSHRPTEP